MRDPNRIPKILNAIGRIWQMHPDMRLFQLLSNVMSPTLDPGRAGLTADPYHIEDDAVYERLRAYAERVCAVNPPDLGADRKDG